MRTEHQDRQRRSHRRRDNECPEHGTKLDTKYYEDLDLLVMKCRIKECTEGHGMIEQFKAKKEKKKQNWVKKNAHKIVEDEIQQIEKEELESTRQ